jgi:hypothetical protein
MSTDPFNNSPEVVIQGITPDGQVFRPSDWADRLCGMMSIFGEDRHLSYSPFLKPIMAGGLRCVVVDRLLEKSDEDAYGFLMQFARDNELVLRPGRKKLRPEDQEDGAGGAASAGVPPSGEQPG